jgi:hypothetical protein
VLAFYPQRIDSKQPGQHIIPSSTFPATHAQVMLHVPASPSVAQALEIDQHDTEEMEAISLR